MLLDWLGIGVGYQFEVLGGLGPLSKGFRGENPR